MAGNKTDSRTRELAAGQRIPDNEKLAKAQAVQNHLQTIQSERASNLALEKATVGQEAQSNELLAQAGAMAAMGGGSGEGVPAQVDPQTQAILGKYGLGAPRIQKTQSRNVQVRPNNITINNTTNTTTTNNVNAGPLAGRGVALKPVGAESSGGQITKFKAWINNVFSQQREASAKRIREFDKRESSLNRQANKMLKKMEEMGKDIANTFNPKNIGTTIGNQFRVLLFLFGATFLATHWKKVLAGIDWVGDKVRGFYNYITGKDPKHSLRTDFIEFFLGKDKAKGKSVMDVFRIVLRDTMDYLKMKLDHAMEERGAAIKSIKFPDLDLSNPMKLLTDIVGYLGNILTAIVDPKRAVENSVRGNLNKSAAASSAIAMSKRGEGSRFDQVAKNTDAGEYAAFRVGPNGLKKYSLLDNALDDSGNLTDRVAAQVSQSNDILGALQDAKKFGKLDYARFSGGLHRLETKAKKKGTVALDVDFVKRMYGSSAAALEQSGDLTLKTYKVISRPKTEDDYASQGAKGFVRGAAEAYLKTELAGKAGDMVGLGWLAKAGVNSDMISDSAKAGGVAGAITGAIGGSAVPGAGTAGGVIVGSGLGGAIGAGAGALMSQSSIASGLWNGINQGVNRLMANDNTLDVVPIDDPKYANYPAFATVQAYQATENAIKALAKRIAGTNTFDAASDEKVAQQLNKALENYGGGKEAINKKWNLVGKREYGDISQADYDIEQGYSDVREFRNLQAQHSAQEKAKWDNSSLGTTEHSIRHAINSGYQALGSAASWAGQFIGNINKSNKISKEAERKNAIYIMDNLVNKRGLQPHQAAGIVGNLRAESGLNPSSHTMDTNKKMAGGLAMWNGSLWEKLHRDSAAYGKPWNDMDYQLDFLWNMLNQNDKQMNDVRARLAAAKTPYEASDAWAYFEKYAGYNYNPNTARQAGWSMERIQREHDTRGANANGIMDLWRQVGGQLGGTDSYLADVPQGGFSGTPSVSSSPSMPSQQFSSSPASFTTNYNTDFSVPSISMGGAPTENYTFTKIDLEKDDFGIRSEYSGADSEKAISGYVSLMGDSYAVGMSQHFVKGIESRGGRAKASCWPGGNTIKLQYMCASGATIQDITKMATNTLSNDATIVVIHAGLNNWGNSEGDIVKSLVILGRTAASKGAKVFFIAPITNQPGKFNSGQNAGNAAKVARAVRKVCSLEKYGLIDLEPSSSKYTKFDSDGIHPTSDGYRMLAKDVVELLFRGGGQAVATQDQQSNSQGVIDNAGFDVSTMSYSQSDDTGSGGGLSGWLMEQGAAMENGQLVSEYTPEQLEKLKVNSALRGEAADLWEQAKRSNVTLVDTNGRKYTSVEEFMENYSTKMNDASRKQLKNRVTGWEESAAVFSLLGDDTEAAEKKLGMSRKEFRKYYKNLDDHARENVRNRISMIANGTDENYEAWKAQFSREELKKMASDVGATNIYGAVADDTLKGVYQSVLNGNFLKRGNLSQDQQNFAASILQRDEYMSMTNQIKSLKDQLTNANGFQEKESIRYNIGLLESQRASLGKNNLVAKAGDKLDAIGEIDRKNKTINDTNKKLAEIEYNKANFEKYFNESMKGMEHLSGVELKQLYNAMWEELCQEQEKAAEHLKEVTGMSEKEMKAYRENVRKATEVRTKHERFTKTSLEDLQKEFDKLSNNGQNYLEGVKAMYEKYGQDALNMLGVTLSDLQEGYARTTDLMFDKLTAFQQMRDIEMDYKMGKISKEEYDRRMSQAFNKKKEENIATFEEYGNKWNIIGEEGQPVWKPMTATDKVAIQEAKDQKAGIRTASNVPDAIRAPESQKSSELVAFDFSGNAWGSHDIGGYTGDGPKYQPTGVVHAGEVVFNSEDIGATISRYGTGPIADTVIRSVKRGADPLEASQVITKLSQFSDLGKTVANGKLDTTTNSLDKGSYYAGVEAITGALASVGQALHSDNEVLVQATVASGQPQVIQAPSQTTKIPRMTK